MASISSLTGTSSSNSIYGNRNVISGLASGMDTESMIENAVSGIKTKISSIQQKRTKVEWQQEDYRSIIAKMDAFTKKYTSYTSNTNLFSNTFFNNAVKTTTNGANNAKVSASGKTSSDVAINRIKQLATAARYTVSGSNLGGSSGKPTAVADVGINLGKEMDVSTIAGTMTLTYGNKTIDLNFGELETFENADAMVEAINKKLSEQKITLSSGEQKAASELISVKANGGTITFGDKSSAGNSIYISSASANIKEKLGIDTSSDAKQNSFKVSDFSTLKEAKKTSDYLADKNMKITVDGITKTIAMPTKDDIAAFKAAKPENANADDKTAYVGALQAKIDKAFGKNADGSSKLTVEKTTAYKLNYDGEETTEEDPSAFKLKFTGSQGSSFSVSSTVGKALGFEKGLTSYVNTGKTLGDLGILEDDMAIKVDDISKVKEEKVDDGKGNETTKYYYEDANGKKVYTDKDGYHINSNGDKLYSFKINDVEIGQYTKDTAVETIMNGINNNADAGVKVTYSKITNEFVFSAKETGAGGQIDSTSFGDGLAKAMFGPKVDITALQDTNKYDKTVDADGWTTYTPKDAAGGAAYMSKTVNGETTIYAAKQENGAWVADTTQKITSSSEGQDAILTATINGTEMELTRSTNVVDLDGLSVTLNETFGYKTKEDGSLEIVDSKPVLDNAAEKITFTSKADSDTIVSAIKSMVEDYNAMVTEIKKAYSTMPAEKRDHSRYEPLTEDDMADMSESAIKAYEEKARQGILFADRDLSSLYSKLRTAITPSGTDGNFLRGIGIETAYSDGLTTISLDEKALRTALETDPDKVRDAFTKTKENGSATNGLMQNLKSTLDNYASTTGASKGILIQKAGSPLAPTSILDNSLKSMLDNYDKQIEKWQGKLSDKVDYYTSKFTQLEKLIAEMNSQSSALMGLMGTGA